MQRRTSFICTQCTNCHEMLHLSLLTRLSASVTATELLDLEAQLWPFSLCVHVYCTDHPLYTYQLMTVIFDPLITPISSARYFLYVFCLYWTLNNWGQCNSRMVYTALTQHPLYIKNDLIKCDCSRTSHETIQRGFITCMSQYIYIFTFTRVTISFHGMLCRIYDRFIFNNLWCIDGV
jgi:hypothetical protein